VKVKFVQISDLHLGSACSGVSWEESVRELRGALSSAVDLAKGESVDLLLMPGDIYEHENESADIGRFLTGELARARPVRVIVSPGNHDFHGAGTLWGRAEWPENVYIFDEEKLGRIELPDLGVCVYGFAHNSATPMAPVVSALRLGESDWIKVLVFHGSLVGINVPGKEATCPFTVEDLVRTHADYAAVGHYHRLIEMRTEAGKLIGAYSGCPAGRGFDETGEKFVLLGEVSKEGVSLFRKSVARLRYHKFEVCLDGVENEMEARTRIMERLKRGAERDIVRVTATGKVPTGFMPELASIEGISLPVTHAEVAWRAEPEYDVESIAKKNTTEGAFAREILSRISKSRSEEERTVLQQALYYGLDALSGRKPEPRE